MNWGALPASVGGVTGGTNFQVSLATAWAAVGTGVTPT
jgi:hypothetical protein